MMEHPNIAKVFDAGATPTGRPFFVMELVRGDPHHRVLRRARACRPRSGSSSSSPSATRCSTRTRKGSSTATSSRRTSSSRCTTACRVPKVIDFGVAKATPAAADRPHALHAVRADDRHAALHEPRAGGDERAGHRHAHATSTRSACCSTSCSPGRTPFDPEELREAGSTRSGGSSASRSRRGPRRAEHAWPRRD